MFVDATTLACVSPAHLAGFTYVDVSNNGMDFTHSGIDFEYYDQPQLVYSNPVTAFRGGGTLVHLVGSNFGKHSFCHVASESAGVKGHHVGSTMLVCELPRLKQGEQRLQVSRNGVDIAPAHVLLHVHGGFIARSIKPALGMGGVTVVTIAGAGFAPALSWGCRFGSITVGGAVGLDGGIACATPAGGNGELQVAVQLNLQDSFDPQTFRFQRVVKVVGVYPTEVSHEGGVTITLFGSGMFASEGTCTIGDKQIQGTVTSDGEMECLTSPGQGGFVRVDAGGKDRTATINTILVEYRARAVVRGVEPRHAVVGGGSVLWVRGAEFVGAAVACRIDDSIVPAFRASSTVIACHSPAVRLGFAALEAANAPQAFSADHLAVEYVVSPEVWSLGPVAGPGEGGTVVTVAGGPFSRTGRTACRFGTIGPVVAHWADERTMECVSPSHALGGVPLEVSSNMADFSSSEIDFVYEPYPLPRSLSQAAGPAEGGVQVIAYGTNFGGVSAGGAAVWLGGASGARAAPTLLGGSALSYTLPSAGAGFRIVVVTNNGADYCNTGLQIEMVHFPRVVAARPDSGPHGGGTLVHVTGEHFRSGVEGSPIGSAVSQPAEHLDARCGFGGPGGSRAVPAYFVSSRLVICEAPARHLPGKSALEVSSSPYAYTRQGVQFTWDVPEALLEAHPSQGPSEGGTAVYITGEGLANSGRLRCAFGSVHVAASGWLSDNAMECVSPAHSTGPVELRAGHNGVDLTAAALAFTYRDTPKVVSIHPQHGPTSGGTLVTVTGNLLTRGGPLVCKFGLHHVQPIRVSGVEAVCPSPAHAAGFASVEVSTSGGNFTTDGVSFEYRAQPVVTLLNPPRGPVGGGTLVRVMGINFADGDILCQFGTARPLEGTFLSSTSLVCETPGAAEAGDVALKVTINGIDFSSPQTLYTYVPEAKISYISPRVGPNRGGVEVAVHGTNFTDDLALSCRFGTTSVPATYVNENTVKCVAPARDSGAISVEVTANDVDFTGDSVPFTY